MTQITLVLYIYNTLILALGQNFLPDVIEEDISKVLTQTSHLKNFSNWKMFLDRKVETMWILRLKNKTSYLHYIFTHYKRQMFKEIPNYCNSNMTHSRPMEMGIFGENLWQTSISKVRTTNYVIL